MRRLLHVVIAGVLVALAAVCSPVAAGAAHASSSKTGGGHTSTSPTTNLALVSESGGTNPNSPPSCLTEDDYNYRTYSGSLNGSYSTSATLCNDVYYNGVYWDSGGIGLQATVYVVGSLSDMTITSPTGTVEHAVWVASSTSKGTTTNEYETCFVPPYSMSSDTGGTALSAAYPGNPWSMTLSGSISNATWYLNALMTDVTYQKANCPASEQNLVP